jgi:hypothetical protein
METMEAVAFNLVRAVAVAPDIVAKANLPRGGFGPILLQKSF